MVYMYYIVSIKGEKFSPTKTEIELGYKFNEKDEVGAVHGRGRYKGTPLPYGYGYYYIDDDEKIKLFEVISKIAILAENKELEISVQLNVEYEAHCNFEIEPEVLKKIASLNIPFGISCYEKEEI